ncbi:MAG: metallophosphoesterase [Mycoplasmataceae bacterium]|nr:metallophosphoesterase [Mycoplasmataceae bacterium]
MKKRILILSDSHGVNDLMVRIIQKETADLVVHAGDYSTSISWMKQHFHYFIDGNNDYDWKNVEVFSFDGFKFLLTHGSEQWSWDQNKWMKRLRELGKENEADVVIFGHSHKELIDTSDKPFLLNPGSISLPRNRELQKSYAIIEIENSQLRFQIKRI